MNESAQKLKDSIEKRIVGKGDVIEKIIIALLAGGHVLLEDVPGVGKTTLAKALADSVSLSFARIQCTPDTMPSDITGISIYDSKKGEFSVMPGPVVSNIVLADELNRTSPKTQSALLEVMEENRVTIDGKAIDVPQPFMVIGTQNPVDMAGTYPLPEAQLDRFMMRLSIGYPDKEYEVKLTKNILENKSPDKVGAVCSVDDIIALKNEVSKVHVSDSILGYIRDISDLTRKEENFVMGVSPRATIFVAKAAQAKAFMENRDFVKPDDVKAVAVNTLHHRVVLTSEAKLRREDPDAILRALILKAKVPMD